MRIVLATYGYPPVTYGGLGIDTERLAHALAALGHVVHVVSFGHSLSRQLSANLFVHHLPLPTRTGFDTGIMGDVMNRGIALHRAVTEIDRRWGVDIVEVPNSPPDGLLIATAGQKPVVVWISSPARVWQANDGWKMEGERVLLCAAEDMLLRRAQGFVPVSQSVFDDLRAAVALPPSIPHQVIHHGLPRDYGGAPSPAPTGEEVRVLVLSRLQPTKGARALLTAIPQVLARNPKLRFDLVARDVAPWTFRADFESAHPELRDRVTFHSGISEERKKELLRRCHMMAAPSLYESFGVMYIEAMACARPVIACPVGGIPEIVRDGETGLLVKPDDEAALTEAILALAADPERCEVLGRAGYERFLDHFTIDRTARETAVFYERVLGKGTR